MLDANVILKARTNLNTVPGREQSILALLYSNWLLAYFISLVYGGDNTQIQFTAKIANIDCFFTVVK